jgi:hypothetical protein
LLSTRQRHSVHLGSLHTVEQLKLSVAEADITAVSLGLTSVSINPSPFRHRPYQSTLTLSRLQLAPSAIKSPIIRYQLPDKVNILYPKLSACFILSTKTSGNVGTDWSCRSLVEVTISWSSSIRSDRHRHLAPVISSRRHGITTPSHSITTVDRRCRYLGIVSSFRS